MLQTIIIKLYYIFNIYNIYNTIYYTISVSFNFYFVSCKFVSVCRKQYLHNSKIISKQVVFLFVGAFGIPLGRR